MVTLLVFLIILLPVFYFIAKWAIKAWKEADREEVEDILDEKLDEVKQVDKLHKKAQKVNVDEFEEKKETINKVTKS